MESKQNRKGEQEKRGKKGESREEKSKEFKKEKTEDDKQTGKNVILMGAPQQKREIPKFTKKEKTETLLGKNSASSEKKEDQSAAFDRQAGDKEGKKPAEIANNAATSKGNSHMNLGRAFFGFTVLLFIYLSVGDYLNWFGSVDIDFVSLWPLILIFIGLLLFKVRTTGGKIIGTIAVVLVLAAALSVLMRGNNIISVVLSGEVLIEEREIEDFEKLVFESVGNIEIIQGEETSLSIEGDKNVLEQITTDVQNGTLTIAYKSPLWNLFLFDVANVAIILTSPTFSGVHVVGSGDIAGSKLENDALSLSISGSGSIVIDEIRTESLTSSISGSGDMILSGVALRLVVSITGSGNYDGELLLSDETGVRISGSGDVIVNTTSLLDVSITGSGNVKYVGSPVLRKGTISGSGSIEAKVDELEQKELNPKEFYEKVKPVF